MDAELQQLKDIHLPQAINMWPIAPGWIALYILLLLLISYALYFWYKARRKKRIVNFALAKLDKLQQLMKENPDINVAVELSTLLRRTALHYFPRENIAGLSGIHWLQFLNRSGGDTMQVTQEVGRLLTDVPYQKNNVADLTPVFALARNWLIAISKNNVTVEK